MTGAVLAHGIGGRQDLPTPLSMTLWGAVVALVVSFVVLASTWRTSRFQGAQAGIPVPWGVQVVLDAPALRWALRVFGLAAAVYVTVAAVAGPDLAINPTAGVVYVLLWIGVPFTSVLLGPVWRLINPLRTLHRLFSALFGIPPERGLWEYPTQSGYWPAAVGLFSFVWLELVAPNQGTLPVIRSWFAVYLAVQLLGSVTYGSRWFERGDPFEARIRRPSPASA